MYMSGQLKNVFNSDDNVYVDTRIENPRTATVAIPAKFRQTRSTNVLDVPSDYYLSIVRTDIPANQIPIIDWFQNDLPSITLSWAGVDYQEFVQYEREDYSDLSKQNIYQYQNVVDMFNTAFDTAFALIPGAAPPSAAPHMILLPNNRGIAIRYQQEYDPAYVGGPTITVSCNSASLRFMQNLPGIYYPNSNALAINGKNYQFKIFNTGNNLYPLLQTAGTPLPPAPPALLTGTQYYQIENSYPTFYMWYSFQKLVITTNTLPVKQEYVGINESGVNVQTPILTDFRPYQFGVGDNTETNLVYNPSPQYRLIDLYSDKPLREIEYSVYYETDNGELNELLLFPGQVMTLKMLFVKKDLFKNST